jgi:hypothetical protein
MSEKEKLLLELVKKSGKNEEDIEKLVLNKVNELSGLVSEEGAMYIIANELGVKLGTERQKKTNNEMKKIKEITEAKVPISFNSKVIRKYDKVTFSSQNGSEGNVQSLLVGDDEAIIRIVFWNDKTEILDNIQENDILKILNAYTRENNNSGRIEVHFGQYSDIEVNPKDVKIELKEFVPQNVDFEGKKINETEEGNRNILLKGTITSFEIPRFYLACPECFKKVFQDEDKQKCAVHGEVEAIRIPIINFMLDDGSGHIEAVAFRDRAEKICSLESKDIISLTEDIEKYNNFSKNMIGASIEVGGNISISTLSGEKQILVNQLIKLETKTIEEVANEIIEEDNNSKKMIEDDLDIEEIDIDDDLL